MKCANLTWSTSSVSGKKREIVCWSLMIALEAYLLNQTWCPEWGCLAKENPYVLKWPFLLIPLMVMGLPCVLYVAREAFGNLSEKG